jgi:chromosome segregation ATPase
MPRPRSTPPEQESGTAAADDAWWKKQLGKEQPNAPTSSVAGESASEGASGKAEHLDPREVEEKLSILEVRRREAEASLQESADRLAALEDELATTLGKRKLAERQAADIDEYMERLHRELAAAKVADARDAVKEAVRVRDVAIEEASEAAAELGSAIERIASARDALQEAHKRLRNLDRQAPRTPPPEPCDFDERWRTLAPKVEAELGARLETELVEAAARSHNYLMVEQLPEHLQELARQRKRDLIPTKRHPLTPT